MSRAAIRYAKAIFEIAESKGTSSAVLSDMLHINKTIGENLELANFLNNPTIKGDTKWNVLKEVFAKTQPQTAGLFQLIMVNKRFEILVSITDAYKKIYDEVNQLELAVVTTAVPMNAALESEVLGKIKTLTSNKITIENKVDPAIIGGFIIRMGDKQFNASIANKLQQLKREFSN
jgi:F-type H+-transporting ATPase subunit delta